MFSLTLHLQKGKAWMMQLLAVACLSIAAKMEETEVPLSVDLQVSDCYLIEFNFYSIPEFVLIPPLWHLGTHNQHGFVVHRLMVWGQKNVQVGEAKFIFEAKTIQRMELLVLSTLKWRMQAVTPFSFIDHFLYKMNGDQMPPRTLIFQSIQLIQSTLKGNISKDFPPFVIKSHSLFLNG